MSSASEDRGNRPSLRTLVISSLSAGATAVVVPLFWERGTLFATAITPVIVALISEGLRRPAERIGEVVPKVARRTPTGAAMRRPSSDAASSTDRLSKHPSNAAAHPRPKDPERPRDTGRKRKRLKHALITGLLAFAIAAVVLTASELWLFGGSVTGDGETTLFGDEGAVQRQDETPPQREPGPTATATPRATSTPEPTPDDKPTPIPTPTPTSAAPAPSTRPDRSGRRNTGVS